VLCEKASAEEKPAIAMALKAPADAVFANAVFAYASEVEPEMVFTIVLLNPPPMERCHWNSRDLFLDPLVDDPPFGQWKRRQDLINVFFFQCKQLQQSLDLILGQVESCSDGLNVTLENPDLKEKGLDLSKFRYQLLLFIASRRGRGKVRNRVSVLTSHQ
jgi:hypothetical protein